MNKNLLIKLPDKEGKVQPQYAIASTERLWNAADEEKRVLALDSSVEHTSFLFSDLAKCTWRNLPQWIIRKQLAKGNIDHILTGMTEEEWMTFRKKHVILRREKSEMYRGG